MGTSVSIPVPYGKGLFPFQGWSLGRVKGLFLLLPPFLRNGVTSPFTRSGGSQWLPFCWQGEPSSPCSQHHEKPGHLGCAGRKEGRTDHLSPDTLLFPWRKQFIKENQMEKTK